MSLVQLIYASRSTQGGGYSYAGIQKLLETAESRNDAKGITGLLCLCRNQFLQILEGERKDVSETYHRISLDRRHTDLELMEVRETDARDFGSWRMKFVSLEEDDHTAGMNTTLQERKEILRKYLPQGGQLQALNARDCYTLLLELRGNKRDS